MGAWSFHQRVHCLFQHFFISLNCHFIKCLFHQLADSSTCCFVKLLFCQVVVSSTCCFINWTFHQLSILSTCISSTRQTILERLTGDKHSSLLRKFVTYSLKKFYNIDTGFALLAKARLGICKRLSNTVLSIVMLSVMYLLLC